MCAGPSPRTGCLPALGWNRSSRGADRQNIGCDGWGENRFAFVSGLVKTSQMIKHEEKENQDSKGPVIMSCSQEREGGKNNACNCLITHFGWLSNAARVMKYLRFFLQQPEQGERSGVFCCRVNDVWLRSLTNHSFQYSPDEYLSISFTLSVCYEDYIINPWRRRIMVGGLTDFRRRQLGQTKLRSYSSGPGFMPFDPLSRSTMASIAYHIYSWMLGHVLKWG